jgi:hypothetical protein
MATRHLSGSGPLLALVNFSRTCFSLSYFDDNAGAFVEKLDKLVVNLINSISQFVKRHKQKVKAESQSSNPQNTRGRFALKPNRLANFWSCVN